jgi:hypothetical protein
MQVEVISSWHLFEKPAWRLASGVTRFCATLIGVPDIPFPPDLNERVPGDMDFFFRHEYRAFARYIPNMRRIRENKVDMVTAVGRDSDDSQYVQATRALISRLRCKCIEFPGQHDVSFYMPQEFANVIKSTLESKSKRRRLNSNVKGVLQDGYRKNLNACLSSLRS